MTTENTQAPGLEIADVQAAVAVIDHAAEQGAFKGWKIINDVATLRTRLANFLAYVAETQKAKQDAAEAETADAPTDPANAAAPVTTPDAGA